LSPKPPAASLASRAASIHARLLNRARERREDFNLILSRYAVERLLYRLSISGARHQFVLKGALLFDLWFKLPHRLTRDADLLGFGPAEGAALIDTIRSVCTVETDDGMVFDPATVTAVEIREDANYGGLRVRLQGLLGNARCPVQLDVGYGDAVTPEPDDVDLPTLLNDLPAPHMRVYPRETVIAEKLEAIVSLGMVNSRMKDYFDLHALFREQATDAGDLTRAVAATFQRRGTPLPSDLPLGLTREFALDAQKQAQWRAFLNKNRLESPPLEDVIFSLADWLMAALNNARKLAGRKS
jgi:hypothetical protein